MSWEYRGGSRGGARPSPPMFWMFWVKEKESQKEEKPAGQATKKRASPFTQGLDPPLRIFAERLQPLDRTKRVTTNSNSEPHIRYW